MKKSSIVVCVNDEFDVNPLLYFVKLLVKGELYVIREIMPSFMGTIGKPGIMLEEIKGESALYKFSDGSLSFVERHFRIDRFVEVLPPTSLELLVPEDSEVPKVVSRSLSKEKPKVNMAERPYLKDLGFEWDFSKAGQCFVMHTAKQQEETTNSPDNKS